MQGTFDIVKNICISQSFDLNNEFVYILIDFKNRCNAYSSGKEESSFFNIEREVRHAQKAIDQNEPARTEC